MSIVASFFSFSSSSSRIRPSGHAQSRLASIMDSLLAIGLGLALRLVVDVVSHQDFRMSGTLVGLWEGVVLMHFLKKMPTSFDPYVAYGVRLFVDLLVTESLARLAIVFLWTGMGMVLADITPVVWYDAGLQRVWRRFRRDLFLLSVSLPSLPSFSKTSITSRVRFHERPSQSRSSSLATSARSARTVQSTTPVTTSTAPRFANIPPTPRKRVVPGSFAEWSETETERDSISGLPPLPPSETSDPPTPRAGTSHFTLHGIPEDESVTEGSTTGRNDLDARNLSSSASSSSSSSDTADPSANNPVEIPDLVEEVVVKVSPDRDLTPKQNPLILPPTPADTLRDVGGNEPDHNDVPPPSGEVPLIPDTEDWAFGEGWENVEVEDAVGPLPGNSAKGLPNETALPSSIKDLYQSYASDKAHLPSPSATEPPRETQSPPPPFEDIYGEPIETTSASVPVVAPDAGSTHEPDPAPEPPSASEPLDPAPIADTPVPVITTEPVSATEPASVKDLTFPTDPASPTKPASATEPTSAVEPTAKPPSVTESAPVTKPASVTEPTTASDPALGPSPSPDANADSASTHSSDHEHDPLETVSKRLDEALLLRKQAIILDHQATKLSQEQTAAKKAGDNALALAKKVEGEDVERKAKRLHKKAEKRFFTANNTSTPSDKLDLTGLTGEEAIRKTEEALGHLLRTDNAATELTLTFAKNAKGKKVKQSVMGALNTHKMIVRENTPDGRILFVTLPH